ncbi:MAG: Holliday junction resolvase RecU [Ruminococcus sp.]|nr:Holliday junction resolvase RecU [Ruminococcus sp.]
MSNVGKVFEASFKKSVPEYALIYRLPDAAQSFGGVSGLRFSRKNPFDFILWDSKRHILYALELKTVSGKSISFERTKEDKGEIHFHQIEGLNEWNKYDGIICGFIIEFREIEKTVFIDIDSFNSLISKTPKKSLNYNDLTNEDASYCTIPQSKKRTRYSYGIDDFLSKSEKLKHKH